VTNREKPAARRADALKPTHLFRRLAARRGLILGVSGGADSTALMVLVARWKKRPPTLVVSVDHGLRAESAAETKLVAGNAARLGLPWRVMKAEKRPADGNLQDWARRARYRLLVAAALDAGFDTIVTAHHEDDQAETFLLRLARGSGVYGLSAMSDESALDGLVLARPLLAVPREVLQRIARRSGFEVVDDPSNRDPRFDRVRVRAALPALTEIGLTTRRLAETARRLGRAAAALDHYSHVLLKEHFVADALGVVSGSVRAFEGAPEEVSLRALALVLKAVGGSDYTPRLDSVEDLRTAILAARHDGRLRRTLAGVVVSVAGERLVARREWGRRGLEDAVAPAGATLLWDRRFEVGVPAVKGVLKVGALGRSERRLRAASSAAERGAVEALPGLYRNGTLVAVPPAVVPVDEGAPLAALEVASIVGRELGISAEEAVILE
jgi:tRNA(Ile)-lysidine synthase